MPLSVLGTVTMSYSFSLIWLGGGELGSCFRFGEVLGGEDGTGRDPRMSPDMLVGGRCEGGLPRPPGNAPESDRAGF